MLWYSKSFILDNKYALKSLDLFFSPTDGLCVEHFFFSLLKVTNYFFVPASEIVGHIDFIHVLYWTKVNFTYTCCFVCFVCSGYSYPLHFTIGGGAELQHI